jgi:hypothetical protein
MPTNRASKSRFERSRVSNLYLGNRTGIYYARARNPAGRDVWRSLQTASFAVAREKLAAMMVLIRAGAGLGRQQSRRDITNFSQILEIYQTRVRANTGLKPSAIAYRLSTVAGLLRSWPELLPYPLG